MDYHLLTFVTVAEKQNFTRAAEALHITQSAVTLSIKALEKKYDVKFFDRTNKYVRLTRAGEIMYHHAKKILTEYEQVEGLIDDISNVVSGLLKIGSSYTFGESLLPKYISNFVNENKLVEPNITIRNSSQIINQLITGELDVGIVDGTIKNHPHLLFSPFEEDEMVVVVSKNHRLANVSSIDLEDLYSETWIIREEGSGTRQIIDRLFKKNTFAPPTIRYFGSTQIIKESIEANLGISILSKYSIQKEIYMKTLHPITIRHQPIKRDFLYVIPKIEYRSRSVELFIEKLSAHNVSYYEVSSFH